MTKYACSRKIPCNHFQSITCERPEKSYLKSTFSVVTAKSPLVASQLVQHHPRTNHWRAKYCTPPLQSLSSSGASMSPSPPWRPTESSSPASKKYRTRKNFYKVPFSTTTTKTDSQLLSSNKKLLISPSPASSSGHLVVIKNSIEAQTNKL